MKTKPTLFFLAFALCVNMNTTQAQVNVQDSLALVDLYDSTDGANWWDHTNWLTKNPVKTWWGVIVKNNNVIALDLTENALNGSIPSSIGNLINLQSLYLSGNHLSDSIPSSIGSLVNLSRLELIGSLSGGSIPSSIGNLVNLSSLDLSGNKLSGSIPPSIGNLINLKALFLEENTLSDSIPSSIGNLVNLSLLYLSGNQLSGSIPSSIGNLINLQSLYLSANQLSGSIPSSIGNLVNLTDLNLTFNRLSGSIPFSIGNLVMLPELDLYYNQLTGSIPSSIGNLKKLRGLFLFNNQLSGSIPSSIGNLIGLSALQLGENQLSGSIPSSIGNLVGLSALDLSGNQLSGSIPFTIGNLVNLRYLNLSNNQLRDSILFSIGNIVRLGKLDLSNNQLSGAIPSSLSDLDVNDPNDPGYFKINNNKFIFDGMEILVVHLSPKFTYGPQAIIPLHQNGNAFFVNAGGTLSNNTYKWYRVEQNDSITIVGDSVLHPSQSGHYFAAVTNSVCTQLTLHTDTIFYDATLPVTIINLTAQQQKSIIKIDWTSVTEINVAAYEIQRSFKALNFTTIGSLTAKGNGTQKVDYTFNDVQPLHGDNYYRIKAVDKDGKTTYSNTVLVNMVNDKIITVVYPNPAKDILHVETNSSATFSLIDQSGKILLMTTNINGKGVINISGVAAGVYYLKNNSTGDVQKVIIAR